MSSAAVSVLLVVSFVFVGIQCWQDSTTDCLLSGPFDAKTIKTVLIVVPKGITEKWKEFQKWYISVVINLGEFS